MKIQACSADDEVQDPPRRQKPEEKRIKYKHPSTTSMKNECNRKRTEREKKTY